MEFTVKKYFWCDSEICPKAFDPNGLSLLTNRRSIRITTDVEAGHLEGSISFTFGLSTVKFNADARTLTNSTCNAIFNQMRATDSVSCEVHHVDSYSGTAMIDLVFHQLN